MGEETRLEELLRIILSGFLNRPDKIKIEEVEEKREEDNRIITVLKVKVDKKDMGLLIGRQGANLTLIRALVKLYAVHNQVFVDLRVSEPEDNKNDREN